MTRNPLQALMQGMDKLTESKPSIGMFLFSNHRATNKYDRSLGYSLLIQDGNQHMFIIHRYS